MQIVSARSALLSNYEVYKLLSEQVASRSGERSDVGSTNIKGLSGTSKNAPETSTPGSSPENLVRIQNETLAYLASEPHPTLRQNDSLVQSLLQKLRPYELTRAEKLMLTNLAPTSQVDLYAIVEEFEDRMTDKSDSILAIVEGCLLDKPASTVPVDMAEVQDQQQLSIDGEGEYADDWTGEEQVFMDEDRYGGHDDLGDEGMEED